MARRASKGRSTAGSIASAPVAADIAQEIARIGGMSADALRLEWRRVIGSDPPPAFSKDLLARAIAYRLQEEALGGLSPATARLLRSLLKPGAEPPRQVKVGSVIVREHKGVLHEVLVVPGGFCWQGKTFDSLSTIAKRITGVTWNGPRFFGLRSKKQAAEDVASPDIGSQEPSEGERRRVGRKSSLRSLTGSSEARS